MANETQKSAERPSLVREFLIFLRDNKKWWLLPILVVIVLMGLLILFTGGPATPFIYTLF